MEIDPAILDPRTREQLERLERERAREAARGEFRALACEDVAEAGRRLLATTSPHDALNLIQALPQDALVEFCRASTARVRARVLDVIPGAVWLRRQLVPDDQVPRLLRVASRDHLDTDDADHLRRRLEHGWYCFTSPRDITPAQAERLHAVGLGHRVRAPQRQTLGYERDGSRTAPEPHKWRGLTLEIVEIWRPEALQAAREIDPELDRMIKAGELVVSDLPLDERRARMFVQS